MIGQIREAIQGSGKTLVELSASTHVSPSQLSRFLRGERDLTLTSAARVCEVLGLELVSRPSRTTRPAKPAFPSGPPRSSSPEQPKRPRKTKEK
ncbi:MAG TPA: helix-turn-helix transcriptional regulator [Gemmataceae bacterium]|nr:helix-turn-helix transcriptional regulator [Gemmataceae bacterium]